MTTRAPPFHIYTQLLYCTSAFITHTHTHIYSDHVSYIFSKLAIKQNVINLPLLITFTIYLVASRVREHSGSLYIGKKRKLFSSYSRQICARTTPFARTAHACIHPSSFCLPCHPQHKNTKRALNAQNICREKSKKEKFFDGVRHSLK